MNDDEFEVYIDHDGTVTHIYADDLATLAAELGPSATRRASRVDYDNGLRGWVADIHRPRCVRPSHVIRGTQQENMNDAIVRGRAANGNIKLNPEKWEEIRRSKDPATRLALRYGVTAGHVRRIRRRTSGLVYRPKQPQPASAVYAPVRLGPFSTRAEALAAEVSWLQQKFAGEPVKETN